MKRPIILFAIFVFVGGVFFVRAQKKIRLASGTAYRSNVDNYQKTDDTSELSSDGTTEQEAEKLANKIFRIAQSLEQTFGIRYNKLLSKFQLTEHEYEKAKMLIINRELATTAAFPDSVYKTTTLRIADPTKPDANFIITFATVLPDDWKERLANAKAPSDEGMRQLLGEDRYADYAFYMDSRKYQSAIIDPLQSAMNISSAGALDESQLRLLVADITAANSNHMDSWHDFFAGQVLDHATQYMASAQVHELENFAISHATRAQAIQSVLDRYLADQQAKALTPLKN